MTTGRPLNFPTAEDLLDAWEDYKQKKEKSQDLICKENFLNETGNYVNLFNEYAKKEEFSGAIKQIESDCKYYLTNKGLKNEFNATITKVLLSANYGVNEKTLQDQNIKAEVNIKDLRASIIKDIEEQE